MWARYPCTFISKNLLIEWFFYKSIYARIRQLILMTKNSEVELRALCVNRLQRNHVSNTFCEMNLSPAAVTTLKEAGGADSYGRGTPLAAVSHGRGTPVGTVSYGRGPPVGAVSYERGTPVGAVSHGRGTLWALLLMGEVPLRALFRMGEEPL